MFWWQQIEEAIRVVEYLILVITTAALYSDYVRKEWPFARQERPIAQEALERIGTLYDIEREITGQQSAERRREVRQTRSRPHVQAFRTWCEGQLARVPAKGDLAQAMRYALTRWDAFTLFLEDGRVAIDNNPAERAIRPPWRSVGRIGSSLAQTPAARPSPTR